MPPLVPPDQLDAVAQRFRLLSEPVRLELLNLLHTEGEMTVGELVETTGHRQANVSKHLSRMTEHALVSRRKEGVYVYYSVCDPTLVALCQLVRGRLNADVADLPDE